MRRIKKSIIKAAYIIFFAFSLLCVSACSKATPEEKKEETVVSSVSVEKDSIAKIDNDGSKVTCLCDIDEDGRDDKIEIDYAQLVTDDMVPATIRVIDSHGRILWSDYLGIPHTGWKSFYYTEIDGKSYLMEYYPPEESQGLLFYSYHIFNFDSSGKIAEYEALSSEDTAIELFKERSGQRLDAAILLASTHDFKFYSYEKTSGG